MGCILRIIGKKLDIDGFILKSKLNPEVKVYKGDPIFKTKPNGKKIPYSCLGIATSNAGFDEFDKQIKDTILFFKKNKEKLSHIPLTKEIDNATLDFGVYSKKSEDEFFVQHFRFSHPLIKLANEFDLGIEIVIYSRS